MNLKIMSAAGALLLAFATLASAVPITGTLDIAGGATLNTTSLMTATQVTSFQNVVVTPGGVTPGSVLDSTINPGDSVVMNFPWVFGSGLSALWQVGGFTFNLASSTIVLQQTGFLAISGVGTIVGNGFDPTPGNWYFTTQGLGDNANFSFSATTVSVPGVPDTGATALLTAAGVLALAVAARSRRLFC